jgi:hypothetical protein
MLVSAASGAGIVWVGSRLAFDLGGSRAALLAGWWLATDGALWAFSRIGLTDVLFTFLLLVSIRAIRRAMGPSQVPGSWGATWRAVGWAGLTTGLCWNTKYNGFLPLVVGLGWVIGSAWLGKGSESQPTLVRARLARLGWIGLIAGLAYLPWLFHVERTHGYARLVEHQRGYFLGPSALKDGLIATSLGVDLLTDPLLFGLGLASILALVPGRDRPIRMVFALALAVPFAAGMAGLWWIQIGIGLIGVLLMPTLFERVGSGGLVLILTLLPGLYTPYLRLWLPAIAGLHVVGAVGVALLANRWAAWSAASGTLPWAEVLRFRGRFPITPAFLAVWLISLSCVSLTCLLVVRKIPPANLLTIVGDASAGSSPWPALGPVPAGYGLEFRRLEPTLRGRPEPLLLLTRPPIRWYLAVGGIPYRLFDPDPANLGQLPRGAWLLVDALPLDNPKLQMWVRQAEAAGQLEELAVDSLRPGPGIPLVTRLDNVSQAPLNPAPPVDPFRLRLFRVR